MQNPFSVLSRSDNLFRFTSLFQTNGRRWYFTQCSINLWNSLLHGVVMATSLQRGLDPLTNWLEGEPLRPEGGVSLNASCGGRGGAAGKSEEGLLPSCPACVSSWVYLVGHYVL